MEHDGDVRQFVLMTRHRPRYRLAEFGENHIFRAQTSPNGRIEFSSPKDLAGFDRVGHRKSDDARGKWSAILGRFEKVFNSFKTKDGSY